MLNKVAYKKFMIGHDNEKLKKDLENHQHIHREY
jgi:hypothetical protein